MAGYQLDGLLVTEDHQASFLTPVVWQGGTQWGVLTLVQLPPPLLARQLSRWQQSRLLAPRSVVPLLTSGTAGSNTPSLGTVWSCPSRCH